MHERVIRAALLVTTTTAALGPSLVQAQGDGLVPTDFYHEVGVGEVAISPDGALVAFTVTTIDEDQNQRHREVWLQELLVLQQA